METKEKEKGIDKTNKRKNKSPQKLDKFSIQQKENLKLMKQYKEEKGICKKLVSLNETIKKQVEKQQKLALSKSKSPPKSNDSSRKRITRESLPKINNNSSRVGGRESVNYTFEKLPRNVNEYQHLLSKSKIVAADVSWVLELREKYKPSEKLELTKNSVPPSFFDRDQMEYLEKVRKQTKEPSEYTKLIKRPLSNTEDHLVRNRLGESPALTLTCFETTLRNFKFKSKRFEETRYTADKKWVANPNQTSSTFCFSDKFPVFTKDSKDIFNKTQKFIWKPLEEKLSRTNYSDKEKFFTRKIVEAKDCTGMFLGEHLSLTNFDLKYGGENLQLLRHLLDQGKGLKQSSIRWEVGLRNGLSKEPKKWNGLFLKLPKKFNYDKQIIRFDPLKDKENKEGGKSKVM